MSRNKVLLDRLGGVPDQGMRQAHLTVTLKNVEPDNSLVEGRVGGGHYVIVNVLFVLHTLQTLHCTSQL